jgi:hypothetical protein
MPRDARISLRALQATCYKARLPPTDVYTTHLHQERPIFRGIGGKLVERKADGLRCIGLHAQLGAVHRDARADEIGKMSELAVNQALDLSPFHSLRTSRS